MKIYVIKRALYVALVFVLAIGLLAGCSSKSSTSSNNTTGNTSSNSANNTSSTSSTSEKTTGPEPLTLPIVKEPLKLTLFSALDGKAAPVVKTHEDIASFKELEKRTGIDIEWQHPPLGQENEQFNLMMASQQFPDLIYWDWRNVPGGPEKAIQDGAIIKLNDLVAQYAPNLTKIFQDYPDARKQAITDNGTLYMFPLIRGVLLTKETDAWWAKVVNQGPQMRKDWLDKLGLQVPKTIDDWHNVLTAFKQNDPNGNGKADEIPFVSEKNKGIYKLAGAWGILPDFYMENGKIKYGSIEPAFKDYVNTLRQWYAENLIDPDFIATDRKNFEAKVTSNIAGSYVGAINGDCMRFNNLMKDKDPNFFITFVPWPVGPTGKAYTCHTDSNLMVPGKGMAISTKDKYLIESTKFLDYAYSEDGVILLNWGIEGESYQKEGDHLAFTDNILHNPDGLDYDTATAKYAIGGISGWATVQDGLQYKRFVYVATEVNPKISEMIKIVRDTPDLGFPPITPTQEESERFAAIMNEITTYRDEMFDKFIMGQEPMENFDKFVQTIKSMGIDEALSIENTALERYNNRK